MARLIGHFIPRARLAIFIVFAILWLLTGIAAIIRELHGNRDTLVSLGLGILPPVIVGLAIAVLLARVVSHYLPDSGLSVVAVEAGLFFFVGGYLMVMREAYHKRKLDEDLANKPQKSSNQTIQRTADRPNA